MSDNSYYSGFGFDEDDRQKKPETKDKQVNAPSLDASEKSSKKTPKPKKPRKVRALKAPRAKKPPLGIKKTIILCVSLILIVGVTCGALYVLLPLFKKKNATEISNDNYLFVDSGFTDTKINNENDLFKVIDSVAEGLGISSVYREFQISDVSDIESTKIYRLEQEYNGVPVYGRSMVVVTDGDGNTEFWSGNYVAQDVDTVPQITADTAVAAIKKYIAKEYEVEMESITVNTPNLVIYDLNGTKSTLAYNAFADFMGESHELIIGCNKRILKDSTAMLFDWKEITTDKFKGEDDKAYSVTIEYEDSLNEYALRNSRFVLKHKKSESTAMWKGEIPKEYKAGINLLSNLTATEKFYSKYNKMILADTGNIEVRFNMDGTNNNACFFPGEWRFEFNEKGLFTDCQPGSLVDVVGHEYTHAVIWENTRLSTAENSEQRALHEGISDVMGEIIEYSTTGKTDWFLSIFRNIAQPGSDYLSNYDDYKVNVTNSYYASTIISHAAYLMSDDLIATGLTKEQLAQLWLSSLCCMTSDATMIQFSKLLQEFAQQMYNKGFIETRAKLNCVINALKIVGLDYADLSTGYSFSTSQTTGNTLTVLVLDSFERPYSPFHICVSAVNDNGETSVVADADVTDNTEYEMGIDVSKPGKYTYILTLSDISPTNRSESKYVETIFVYVNAGSNPNALNEKHIIRTDYAGNAQGDDSSEAKVTPYCEQTSVPGNEELTPLGELSKGLLSYLKSPIVSLLIFFAIYVFGFAMLMKAIRPK